MPAAYIDPFDFHPAEIKNNDEVEFITETEQRKKFVGRVVSSATHDGKTFYDLLPIPERTAEFPEMPPGSRVRLTLDFITRKLTATN